MSIDKEGFVFIVIIVVVIPLLGASAMMYKLWTSEPEPTPNYFPRTPEAIKEDRLIREYHTTTRNKEYARKWISEYCDEDAGLCRVEDFYSAKEAYDYGRWLQFKGSE